jgi:hypothetical protein
MRINLHSAKVRPCADQLRARRVPFIFITGYPPAYTLHECFGDLPCAAAVRRLQRAGADSAAAR